jgi:small subunit ribosomal protein S16
MVKIRLRRTGAKKQPTYRVVVADSRSPRDGRFIEIIGHYNPRTEPMTVKIQEERALYWLSVGAQPTDPVKKLLENMGTLDRFARLKAGADLAALLAEAKASAEGRGASAEADASGQQDGPEAANQAEEIAQEVSQVEEASSN